MSTDSTGLKNLHELHIQLQKVLEGLDRGPKQISARTQFLKRKQGELEEHNAGIKQSRMRADAKSLELKSNEAKIAELRIKLNTASSNREYDIISKEIQADTMANSVLEDEILEMMEKIDVAVQQTEKLIGQVAAAESELKRIESEVVAAEPGLKARAAELEQAIRTAESALPADVRDKYRRLVQAHGAQALAPVEGEACTACNVGLSPQVRVELRAGQIVFCRSCGRLLYLPEHG